MKIGIIGTGNVGSAVGKRWAAAGHEVMFGTRDPGDARVRELVAAAGGKTRVGTIGAAATFGDVVLRKCKLAASLPSTSVGKEWRGLIGAGITTERTGVQIETPVLGFKIGLKEGIEVHVIGLSIGVDFWPPAIIVPVGPGRSTGRGRPVVPGAMSRVAGRLRVSALERGHDLG